METFILAFILILAAVAGLAVGVLFGRAPIKGSCGGLNCADGGTCACGRHEGR